MSDYRVLWRIRLAEGHTPTGRTRHTVGGTPAPLPAELRIVQYAGDQGYYLFYCDESGKEFTDTYHETVEEAKAQAKWEFEVGPEEWEPCL
jgi:hypothetical protein